MEALNEDLHSLIKNIVSEKSPLNNDTYRSIKFYDSLKIDDDKNMQNEINKILNSKFILEAKDFDKLTKENLSKIMQVNNKAITDMLYDNKTAVVNNAIKKYLDGETKLTNDSLKNDDIKNACEKAVRSAVEETLSRFDEQKENATSLTKKSLELIMTPYSIEYPYSARKDSKNKKIIDKFDINNKNTWNLKKPNIFQRIYATVINAFKALFASDKKKSEKINTITPDTKSNVEKKDTQQKSQNKDTQSAAYNNIYVNNKQGPEVQTKESSFEAKERKKKNQKRMNELYKM